MKIHEMARLYLKAPSIVMKARQQPVSKTAFAALACLSYLTIIIPLAAYCLKKRRIEHIPSNGGAVLDQNPLHAPSQDANPMPSGAEATSQIAREAPFQDKNLQITKETTHSQSIQSHLLHADPWHQMRSYPGPVIEATPFSQKTSTRWLQIQIPSEEQVPFDISIRAQDVFESGADVTVNAANAHMGGGTGIDGATHKAGGKVYQAAHFALGAKYKNNFPSGIAEMIKSGRLQSKGVDHVIVVVGPQGASVTQDKQDRLYSCYFNALLLAHAKGKKAIAFPGISTGVYLFPKDEAARISWRAIVDFCRQCPNSSLRTISIHGLPGKEKDLYEPYRKAFSGK